MIERLLFILEFCGLEVLMSVNKSSSHDRLLEISKMMYDSKFSIHDLSRNQSKKKGEYARFNMPFEFGIDFGIAQFAKGKKNKAMVVLDNEAHEYDRYLSDLSGRDILYHKNDPLSLFEIIPNWLSIHTNEVYDSPYLMRSFYQEWKKDYKQILKAKGYDLRSIAAVPLTTYHMLLKPWLKRWKKAEGLL